MWQPLHFRDYQLLYGPWEFISSVKRGWFISYTSSWSNTQDDTKLHRQYKYSTPVSTVFPKSMFIYIYIFFPVLSYDKTKSAADSLRHKDSRYAWLLQNELFRLTFRLCIIHQKVPRRSAEGFKRLFWGTLVPKHCRIRCIWQKSSPSGCNITLLSFLLIIWLHPFCPITDCRWIFITTEAYVMNRTL